MSLNQLGLVQDQVVQQVATHLVLNQGDNNLSALQGNNEKSIRISLPIWLCVMVR